MIAIRGGTILIGFVLLALTLGLMVLSAPMADAVADIAASIPSAEVAWDTEMDSLMKAVVIDPSYSHALEEHPDSAAIVWQCFNDKGQTAAFQIEPGKRFLRICMIDEVTVGFEIVDIVGKIAKEKTAYIKDGLKSLNDVFKYAQKMGYARFTRPIFQ
jgi:hypothetical protein